LLSNYNYKQEGIGIDDENAKKKDLIPKPVDLSKSIVISPHAREKMFDRGASESEVQVAISTGNSEPARRGRIMFRKNFSFNSCWRGKHYAIKQVAPIITEETDKLVVVTVYVYYF